MSRENQTIQQKLEKIGKQARKGIQPYPNDIRPAHTCSDLSEKFAGWDASKLEGHEESYSLAGRIMARRSFGKAGFLRLRDRTGELQVFCEKNSLLPDEFSLYEELDLGDFVFVSGRLFRTRTGELTLRVLKFVPVAKCLQGLPEKWHGLTDVEIRYRRRYVDLIANPEVRETFVKRSRIIREIRETLLERDFLEVETPMMHPIPGGAAARPFVTHYNKLNADLYLRIAPELYLKRLVVGGFERVFEINRSFRNEGISIQHNPEFTMLELYQSYATYSDLIALTEEMFSRVVQKVCGSLKVDYQGETIDFTPPYRRMTLVEALRKTGELSEREVLDKKALEERCHKAGIIVRGSRPQGGPFGGGLGLYQTLLFEHLVERELKQPTFITEFPTEVSPLARRNDKNPLVTDRFELFVWGREIANAFSELNDPEDQKKRFLAQVEARQAGDEEAMYFDADYIRALEYGMPPTAGEGIGIDRLVMFLTNSPSIRDVILFPLLRPEKSGV